MIQDGKIHPQVAATAPGSPAIRIPTKEQANELVNAAQQKSIEIKTDTDQYVDDVLNDVEHRLDLLLRKVREDRGYFNNN